MTKSSSTKKTDSTSKQFLVCYNAAYEKMKKNAKKSKKNPDDDIFSDREDDYETDDDEFFDDVQVDTVNANDNANTFAIPETNFQIYYDDDYDTEREFYDFETGRVRPIRNEDIDDLLGNGGGGRGQRRHGRRAVRTIVIERPPRPRQPGDTASERRINERIQYRQLVSISRYVCPNERARFLAFYPHFFFPFFENNRIKCFAITFSEIRHLLMTDQETGLNLASNGLNFETYLYRILFGDFFG